MVQQYAGLDIVKELIEFGHLSKGQHVLDVGCGIGSTACLLAKSGYRVVGVDISPGMIDWAREKAREAGVEDKVEFRVADAENLPFDDATFDIVISRFVLAFVEDREKVISEYVRVVKPGGRVCLNESAWLKTPDPKYLLNDFRKTEKTVQLLSVNDCEELLSENGLKDIVAKLYEFGNRNMFGNNSRPGIFVRIFKLLQLFGKSQRSTQKTSTPPSVTEYYGYGLYCGKK